MITSEKQQNVTNTGTREMTSAAKYAVEYPSRGSVLETPYNPDAMVGKLGRYNRTSIYSFHAVMPVNIPKVMTAEVACGSMTLKNTLEWLAPSINAASA